jgi:hypothetical protein
MRRPLDQKRRLILDLNVLALLERRQADLQTGGYSTVSASGRACPEGSREKVKAPESPPPTEVGRYGAPIGSDSPDGREQTRVVLFGGDQLEETRKNCLNAIADNKRSVCIVDEAHVGGGVRLGIDRDANLS